VFYCCKIKKNFKVLLAQDREKLQAVSSLKTSNSSNVLAGMSIKYQLFALNKVNLNRINFIYFEMNMIEVQRKMEDMKWKKINLINESEEDQSFNE